ncbi:MAG: tetratricopeptide repeat protein [Verrucomicrobiota bacterium]
MRTTAWLFFILSLLSQFLNHDVLASNQADRLIQQARQDIRKQNFSSALETLNQAIGIAPNHATAYDLKGATLTRMGKDDPIFYDKAIASYEKLVSLRPDSELVAAFNIGECYFLKKDYDKAIIQFQKFSASPIAKEVDDLLKLKLFLCHLISDNKVYVSKALENAVPSAQSSFYYYANSAKYYHEGNKDKAKGYFNSAAGIYPPSIHRTMADSLVELEWITSELTETQEEVPAQIDDELDSLGLNKMNILINPSDKDEPNK